MLGMRSAMKSRMPKGPVKAMRATSAGTYGFLEGKFMSVLWMVLVLVQVMWLVPEVLREIGVTAFPYRTGFYTNMAHVRGYLMAADTCFFITLAASLVFTLAMAGILLVYAYETHHRPVPVYMSIGITTSSVFRVTAYAFLVAASVLVSVAAITRITCVDNIYMRQQAMVLKYVRPQNIADIKTAASAIYRQGYGGFSVSVAPSPQSGLFLNDGFLAQQSADGTMRIIPNATLYDYQNRGQLFYDGVPMSRPALDLMLKRGDVKSVKYDGTGLYFTDSVITPTDFVTTDPTFANLDAVNFGVTSNEILDPDSAVRYFVGRMAGAPESILAQRRVIVDSHFQGGLAMAYIATIMDRHVKSLIVRGEMNDVMDPNIILDAAARCDVGIVYADVVYIISQACIIVVLISMVFYKKWFLKLKSAPEYHYDPLPHSEELEDLQHAMMGNGWDSFTPLQS